MANIFDTSFIPRKYNKNEVIHEGVNYKRESPFDKLSGDVNSVQDPRYGKIRVLKRRQGSSQVALKQLIYVNEGELVTDLEALKTRMGVEDRYLMTILDFSTSKESNFCQVVYYLKIYFEYNPVSARELSARKKSTGLSLSDVELTHMVYNVISAGAALQKKKQFQGFITPDYINKIGETPIYELSDYLYGLTRREEIQYNKLRQMKEHYSSPEKYKNFASNLPSDTVDPYKNDVWGLGLSILDMTSAYSMNSLYLKDGQFDINLLMKIKRDFAESYLANNNNLLVSLVDQMVTGKDKRPDFLKIQRALPPYKDVVEHLETRYHNRPSNGSYRRSTQGSQRDSQSKAQIFETQKQMVRLSPVKTTAGMSQEQQVRSKTPNKLSLGQKLLDDSFGQDMTPLGVPQNTDPETYSKVHQQTPKEPVYNTYRILDEPGLEQTPQRNNLGSRRRGDHTPSTNQRNKSFDGFLQNRGVSSAKRGESDLLHGPKSPYIHPMVVRPEPMESNPLDSPFVLKSISPGSSMQQSQVYRQPQNTLFTLQNMKESSSPPSYSPSQPYSQPQSPYQSQQLQSAWGGSHYTPDNVSIKPSFKGFMQFYYKSI